MIIYFMWIIIALISLYLILIMPKIFNRPDVSNFMDTYYAHRGLHQNKNVSPENSLAAFRLAVDSNYGIELDVQLTKDLIPVVFHDSNLKRLCDINKNVRDLSFDELRKLNLYDSEEKIPSLEEVLTLVRGRVPLIIELKVYSREDFDCPIIASYLDNYQGLYCIESFNPIAVLWYKKNRPQIVRGQLATKKTYKKPSFVQNILNFSLRNLMCNFFTKPDFIAYDKNYSHLISYNICKTLYKPLTVAYTIQSQDSLDKQYKKFDLFIFDSFIPQKNKG